MLNENAKKWVEALESDKYKQTQGSLAREDPETREESYCCLGVACVVAMENGVIIDKTHGNDYTLNFNGEINYLPKVVTSWLGLKIDTATYIPFIEPKGVRKSLVLDNDSGKTFKEIAEIIKLEPEGLFV